MDEQRLTARIEALRLAFGDVRSLSMDEVARAYRQAKNFETWLMRPDGGGTASPSEVSHLDQSIRALSCPTNWQERGDDVRHHCLYPPGHDATVPHACICGDELAGPTVVDPKDMKK